jgi:DNA modification methylase
MWVWLFDIAESCGYGVRSMIAWDKGTPGMGRGWRSQHELILWAAKATPPFDKHASGVGNVIRSQRTGNVLHTTEKPVELLAVLLKNTPFAKRVADPFLGSGSTLIAAEQVGCQCFGIELDPEYVAVILERAEKFGLTPKLESGDA